MLPIFYVSNDFISQNLLYSLMKRPLDYNLAHTTGPAQAGPHQHNGPLSSGHAYSTCFSFSF